VPGPAPRLCLAFVLVLVLGGLPIVPASAAQLQQGSIEGIVLAPDGTGAASAEVVLADRLGTPIVTTTTADTGRFVLTDVAPGTYRIRADAPPLHAVIQQVTVTSAVRVRVEMRLSALASEQVVVRGGAAEPASTTTRVTMGGESVRRAPARLRSRGLQDAIATVPGWSTEDNGLLHVRGVDDGFLYVIDGVPVYERLDGLFGMAPDPAMVDSLSVVTGYIPPEFGWKAGGVIEVRSAARSGTDWTGALDTAGGTDDMRDVSLVSGGPAGGPVSLTFGVSRQSSARFLDPVHPDNLHNEGRTWSGGTQLAWSASSADSLTAVAGVGRSRFQVPHSAPQAEAGQDQRQRLGQSWQSVSWQRSWSATTVSQISAYHRAGSSDLEGSDRDVPVFTNGRRTLRRSGLLAGVSWQRGKHLFKAGAEGAWLRLDETFGFAVTDPEHAEGENLSDAALQHTLDNPFSFQDSAQPSLYSVYVQDSLRLSDSWTVDAGVRVDWSRLLTAASQVSPRAGAAYHVPASGTTVRASFGRFLQPPQPENLLLASSHAAWRLSPFRTETGGGAALEPERQWFVEAGVEQSIGRRLRLDLSVWRRSMTNVADPNVFFGTTIVFPNSVAEGHASGLDVRLEVPRRAGWSGYLSYANSRVVQYGPVTGGLFLEDDVLAIGPGTAFTPDHDQRNVGAYGVSYDGDATPFSASFTGRYESGTPLEVGDEAIEELRERPGAELVDFDRGRVKPRAVFDVLASARVLRRRAVDLTVRVSVLNLAGRRWAYNFGNPFSGTHFGPGRTLIVGARLSMR
jgi:outer membrane receptor protein involved in Fe transport